MITPLLLVSCYPPKPFAPLPPLEGNTTQITTEVTPPEVVPDLSPDQQHEANLEKFRNGDQTQPFVLKPTTDTEVKNKVENTVGNVLPDPTSISNSNDSGSSADSGIIQPTNPQNTSITPPPVKKKIYPYARAVEGKPGFVFNPYTSTKIDVRGFASGTLVSAPGDATQKFYVP